MQTSKFILCVLLFTAFAFTAQAQKSNQGKGKNKGNQEVSIQTSAQCEMCKERIEKALAFEKGVKRAELDLETKKVMVVYNGKKTDANSIRQVIAGVGYDADDVPAENKAYDELPACCQKGGHDQ